MMKLSDYISLSLKERTSHLDLSSPCAPSPKGRFRNKEKILIFLGVENDIDNWSVSGICRIHACPCDSQNGWCRNPLHYFIGSPSENLKDYTPTGKGYTSGKAAFINPETGEAEQKTVEEARSLGWKGVATAHAGTAMYKDPETGIIKRLTSEQASLLGWVGFSSGLSSYKDPLTGKVSLMSSTEAKERGWIHINQGRQIERKECPHCKELYGPTPYARFHGNNCVKHEGSWRWFKSQLRAL